MNGNYLPHDKLCILAFISSNAVDMVQDARGVLECVCFGFIYFLHGIKGDLPQVVVSMPSSGSDEEMPKKRRAFLAFQI